MKTPLLLASLVVATPLSADQLLNMPDGDQPKFPGRDECFQMFGP